MTVRDKLYDFQIVSVDKFRGQSNVLLADDMGLGKTYQAIALDEYRRIHCGLRNQKTLVIAPLSVLPTWRDHFTDLTKLTPVVIDRHDREMSRATFEKSGDVFCTNWESLRLKSMEWLLKVNWLHIIADECHRASNRKAQMTKALWKIPAQYKTGLSGTPTTGYPDKLWAILHWLYPKEFRSYWKFYKDHVDYEIQYPQGYHKILGPKNVPALHAKIEPYYLRRKKEEVLKDLPDKYYNTIWVDMTPAQKSIYNQMKKDMLAWVSQQEQAEKPIAAPVVIAQMMRLQQFACAYADIHDGKVKMTEPSSKLDAVMEIIDDSDPDQPLVVYSNFRQLIELLEQRLTKAKIPAGYLTGTVSQSDRDKAVRDLQEGRLRVFAATIQAGGVGITLTRASHIVFLDRNWSPALNAQAEDRLHRIGQQNAVLVTDIMARQTVDLGRAQRLELKWSWIKQLLGDKK